MAEDKLTFAAIVLVAIVAIVGMIGLMGFGGMKGITGLEAGELNVTIQGTTSIQLTDAASNFGTGYVTVSTAPAIISTNGTKSGWTNTSSPWLTSDPMVLINNGTSRAKVNISAGSSAATFIGGTSPAQKYTSISASSNCTGTQETTWVALTTSETNLCSKLEYGASQALTIHYELTIPFNATQSATARSNTITFTGTAAD